MTTTKWITALLLASACFLTFGACNNNAPANRQEGQEKDAGDKIQDGLRQTGEGIKDAANETAAALDAEREDLSRRLNNQIKDLDAELNAVDAKIERASANEKIKFQERRKRLAEERDELNAALRNLGQDMKNGWEDFKAEVNRTIEKIDEDLKRNN